MLKRFSLVVTSFVILVTPALAQQYVPSAGSGNLVMGPGGRPVTPNTPAYVGQSNGEAYHYRGYASAGCRVVVRHEWRNGHRVNVRHKICR
jgi:hypothetical protein